MDTVLDDVANKVRLLHGHILQRTMQEGQMRCVFEIVSKSTDRTTGVLQMDYKMKFEPIYFREKSTEFLGKKGSVCTVPSSSFVEKTTLTIVPQLWVGDGILNYLLCLCTMFFQTRRSRMQLH